MEDDRAVFTPDFGSIPVAEQKRMCAQTEGRLKSRCLGLLEVSSDSSSGNDMRDRAVRFMHQSVADFLEKGEVSSRMAASLQRPFSPFLSLMRSSLLDLKHLNITFLHGQQPAMLIAQMWFRFAWAIIKSFAYYTVKAEIELGTSQIELVEELDRAATKLYQVYVSAECRFDLTTEIALRPHWSERRQEGVNLIPIQANGSLISWACEHQLFHFVQTRLTPVRSQITAKRPTSSQARFALMVEESCADQHGRDPQMRRTIREALTKLCDSPSSRLSKLSRTWGTKRPNGRTDPKDDLALVKKTREYDKNGKNLEPGTSAVAFNSLLLSTAFSK